jgi:hypothetical protein
MPMGIFPNLSTASYFRMHIRPPPIDPCSMTQNLSAGVRALGDDLSTSSPGADDTVGGPQAIRAQQSDRARPTASAAAKRKARRRPSAPKPPQQKPHQKPQHKSQQDPPRQQRASRSSGARSGAAASPSSSTSSSTSNGEHAYPQRRVRIGSPDALLAIVPWLLEFEPSNSMVVVGTEAPRAQVRITLRYDLPDPPDARVAAAIASHAANVLAAQGIDSASAVGYGPAHLVTPVADALLEIVPQVGVVLTELLRAENERYWSYLCAEPGCCPPEGVPFDVTDHPAAQTMAAAASARVLSSRAELAATVATVEGDIAEAMDRATRKAEEQVARLIARAARSGRQASIRRLIATAGLRAVGEAIKRYRRGSTVGPETAAWLTVVLRDLRVRDDAWARMLPEHRVAHLRLWTDITRMARPGYVCAPAALLAFVAWQSGNGALANVAIDRALAEDPYYSMARLLREAVDSGAPPSLARLPMTPEEVAACYDELEADDDEDDVGSPAVKVDEDVHGTSDDSPGEGSEGSEGREACDTPLLDG